MGWLAAVTFLVFTSYMVDEGSAQARCFNLEFFSCSGSVLQQAATGEECCNQGFLAFEAPGVDACIACTQNGVCSSSTTCSEPFDASRAQSNAECCATGSGVAYNNSMGDCVPCPTTIDGCFPQRGCSGASIPLSSSGAAAQARECCVSNTEAMSYSLMGQCFDCTVYGFLQSQLSEAERGQGFFVEIGYIKRPPTVRAVLRGDITVESGGTAAFGEDFTLSSSVFTIRPTSLEEIIVTYRVDSIAQELMETGRLRLMLRTPPPPGAIAQDTLDLFINDSDIVTFGFTEVDYRSNEAELQINSVINKDLRIANPVTFQLAPLTVDQADSLGVTISGGVPPNSNPLSPNRAQIDPVDRQDFSPDLITVRFEADENGVLVNDVPIPIPIRDDEINEATEELFLIHLTLQESINAGGVVITRNASLCRISDNDDIRIGFQNASYTFMEPQFEQEVTGIVFIEKQDGRVSEQTFPVVFEVRMATPNPAIFPASLSTMLPDGMVIDNDYILVTPDSNFIVLNFFPDDQLLEFSFTLFPDDLPEGTEAFQASAQPSEQPNVPVFLVPDANVLFQSTFIVIEDDDDVLIGFEQNYTVFEDVGSFEACFRVINPTEDQPLTLAVDLVVDTIEGTASELDFTPIRSSNLGVFERLSTDQRRACFEVFITQDIILEETETFSLSLSFDELVSESVQNQVAIDPSQVFVDIVDASEVVIGWEATVYNVDETDGLVELCAVIVEGELTFELPAINIQIQDGSAVAGSDYTDSPNPSSFVFSDSAPTRQCTEIMIVNDDSFEEDMENFFVNLVESSSTERVTINPSTAEIIITDNDMVTIGFVETEVSVIEGDDSSASLGVRVISGTLDRPVELQLATRDGSASSPGDYSNISMMFTFSPGFSGIREFSVPIVDDNIFEFDEDFFADLTLLSDSDRITIEPDLATVTIVDNDVVRIGLEREVYITRENETEMICAIVLDDSPSLDRQVIITISSTDGSATAPDDYNQINENLTFGPGMSRACIEVTLEEDGVVEGPESFNVTLTDGDRVELDPDTAIVVIEEVEMVTVMFRLPSYNFNEDGITGTIEIVKSDFTVEPFSVRVTGGPSDQPDIVVSAAGIDEVVTFEGGLASEDTIEISFDLTDDEIALEPVENYIASLSIEGSPAFVVLGTISTTTINVLDNDVVTVGFGRPDLTVDEDAGTFMMCVVLEGQTLQNITVTIESVDGSATSPSDYSASSIPSSLVILAGDDRECFEGDIVDDSILEPTESFTLTITAVTPDGVTIGLDVTVISINDNDASVRFELPEYTFSEPDGSGMVCLIKDFATSNSVTANVTTSPGTASANMDYGPGPYTVTFSSMANDRQCITIPIIADSITEGSETFTADIVITPGSGLVLGTPATTIITITEPEPTVVLVNDTAIGDPLMTVPIFVSNEDLQELGVDRLSLCYEIHGVADQFFNLITDECTSVNAHYIGISKYLNIIGQIGVRASDDNRQCREILVDVDGCMASVGGTNLGRYMSAGISVRRYSNRVRISVPNCNEQSLVMWVFCESHTLDDPEAPNGQLNTQMIKFVVMRGLNFGHRDAHGLIGQFWNRPARVTPFEGVDRNGRPVPERYEINIASPISLEERSFTGWLFDLTWEFEKGPCLYVGDRQGGPIYEVTDPNDPVIEGRYRDYRVVSAFSEDGYRFGLFNNDMCVEIGPGLGTDEPLSIIDESQ